MEAIVAGFVIFLIVASVVLMYSLLGAEKAKSTTKGARRFSCLSKLSLKRVHLKS